jgi:hypothetical protein
MVERELERRLEDFARRLVDQHIDPRQAGIDWNAFRESQRDVAREAVAAALALDEVTRREQLQVTEEEVEREVGRYAERTGRTPAAVRAALEKEGGLVRVAAVSSYAQGGSASAQAAIGTGLGGAVTLPSRPMLLGNSPNPAVSFTRIAFALPNGMGDGVALRVYDAGGRLMRTFAGGFSPGANEVLWDGTDASGARAPAGVYFYRLDAGVDRLTQKLVFVR